MNEEIPDYAMIPAADAPAKLIPASEDLRSSRLRITEIHRMELPELKIEEDVLVPDTRPDLEKIVSIEAKPEVSSYEAFNSSAGTPMLKVSGNFEISTLYIPAGSHTELMSITSRIPFRYEAETGEPVGKTAEIQMLVKFLHSKVINERKIRITAGAGFSLREYGETETELLEGVKGDALLLKKERIHFTDLAQRRTDTIDIREKIRIKDNQPAPSRILKYDVNIVENRRQMARGKAVIEATVYYSILYENEAQLPVFYRGKRDFTQFIRLPELNIEEVSGSLVNFEIISSTLNYRDGSNNQENDDETDYDEDASGDSGGDSPYLQLDLTAAATIQIYRDITREIVTDMYHRTRDLDFSVVSRQISELCGTGTADISVRDTVNIPENKGSAGSVPYISVKADNLSVVTDTDRCAVEGVLVVDVIFTDEETGEISSCSEKVDFRTVVDLPGAVSGSSADCTVGIRDIWFDRMNGRQVDFNCGLSLHVSAWKITPFDFIDKVCYVEYERPENTGTGMVLYMVKPDDTQWSVAKKFRTTLDSLRIVNNLEEDDVLEAGRRLLIV